MTRDEFYEQTQSVSDLIDFCNENDMFDFVEDIVDEEQRDDKIDEYITDAIRYRRWYDIYDVLDCITSGYDYYIYHDIDNIEGFTSMDFSELRERVFEYCIDSGIIDEDDEEECDEEDEYTEEDDEDDQGDDCEDPDTDDEFSGFIFGSIGKQCSVVVKSNEDDLSCLF